MFKRFLGMSAAMAIALGGGLVFSSLTAVAQTPPGAVPCGYTTIITGTANSTGSVASDACLNAILTQLVTQATTQASNLTTNQASTAHLVTQIQNWTSDHVTLNPQAYTAGNQLLQQFTQNENLITSESNTDQNALNHFQQLVPNYTAGQDYQKYLVQQQNNRYATYAQSLGVSDTAVTNEAQVQSAVTTIAAASPQNELQALQQLVSLARLQISQMDSLLKIQAAMMKSMSVSYSNWMSNGGAQQLGDTSSKAALDACLHQNPFLAQMSPAAQASAVQACQTHIQNAASGIQNP